MSAEFRKALYTSTALQGIVLWTNGKNSHLSTCHSIAINYALSNQEQLLQFFQNLVIFLFLGSNCVPPVISYERLIDTPRGTTSEVSETTVFPKISLDSSFQQTLICKAAALAPRRSAQDIFRNHKVLSAHLREKATQIKSGYQFQLKCWDCAWKK